MPVLGQTLRLIALSPTPNTSAAGTNTEDPEQPGLSASCSSSSHQQQVDENSAIEFDNNYLSI